MFIDKTFHLLVIEFCLFIHLKMLNPGHFNRPEGRGLASISQSHSLRFRSIKPDNFHILERKLRLFSFGIGKIILLKQQAPGLPGFSLIISQAKGNFIAFLFYHFCLLVFSAEQLSPARDIVRNIKDHLVRRIDNNGITGMSHIYLRLSYFPDKLNKIAKSSSALKECGAFLGIKINTPGFILIFLRLKIKVPLPLKTVTAASRVEVCSDISVPLARHKSVWFEILVLTKTLLKIPSFGNSIVFSKS